MTAPTPTGWVSSLNQAFRAAGTPLSSIYFTAACPRCNQDTTWITTATSNGLRVTHDVTCTCSRSTP